MDNLDPQNQNEEELFKNTFNSKFSEFKSSRDIAYSAIQKVVSHNSTFPSEKTIRNWSDKSVPELYNFQELCRGYYLPYDYFLQPQLLAPDIPEKGSDNGIDWAIDKFLFQNATEDVKKGVKIICKMLSKDAVGKELRLEVLSGEKIVNEKVIRNAVISAIYSRVIKILNVERDHEKEKVIRSLFPKNNINGLVDCRVTKFSSEIDTRLYSIFQTEAVGYLAAHETIGLLDQSIVGITGGTSIGRLIASLQYNGASPKKIVSLISGKPKPQIIPFSANALLNRMVYKFPGSIGVPMPYIEPDRRYLLDPEFVSPFMSDNDDEKSIIRNIKQTFGDIRNSNIIYISVGDFDYGDRQGDDVQQLGELYPVYENLPPSIQKKCVGDILLNLVDDDGNQITDITSQKECANISFSIGLQALRDLVHNNKRVCLLAAKKSKARVIRAAINGGYINQLYISNSVADELIKLGG